MGLRGPKPLPPEIKRLKGNPGKRRLALTTAGVAPPPARCSVDPPTFLTEPAEIDAFNAALGALPAHTVRSSDVAALGRWACWLKIWVDCKRRLGRNRPDQKFDHKRMNDAEMHLARLENAIGLSPAARGAIVARLFQIPAAPVTVEVVAKPAADDESPLGFLKRAGRQFD
jgi:hypothetical protein